MPDPFITVDDVTVGEQDSFALFTVRLSAPSTNTVTVGYNQSNGTALNGSDYQALGNHVLTFAPGETVKTVQVNLLNNVALEPTESFYFNLFTPTNAQIKTEFARATIVDNDATAGAPVVSLSDFVIDESAREASFAVTLSRPSTGVVSMNYATVNGTALAGSDYVAKSGSLSFAPGETAKTVTVTLTNDTLAELAESFSLQISALSGATTLDALGTAVIEANDAPAAVLPFITVGDAVAGEQDTYANFVVRLSAPSANTVTVGYNQSNGTALNGSDYQALGNHVLTFAPGETVKTVQVNLLNNVALEPTESFYFNLFTPTNAQIKTEFARATIVDNDATAGAPVVSLSDFVIDESAREASFAVTLSRPSTGVVSMNYATVNGTALAGSDYVAKSGSLSFAPGETAKTVTVTLTNDTLAELAESFSLQISALSGATTLDALGTAVIEANDAPAAVLPFITVGDAVAGEQDTYANFVVRLSAPSANTVTVGYNQSNGTALNGSDYQALGNHVLTFAPGETVKTVQVNLLDNTVLEPTESFYFNLFTPTNAQIKTEFARATIVDNDATAGAPVVSLSDFVIDESAREASFAVTLSRPSTGVVSMNYATVNGTALAGSDYVAKSGSLSFAPGETAKTVTVTLTNDTLAELAESFSLQISALSGATTLDALGTAVIEANDAPAAVLPFITVGDAVAGEQDTYANFVVRLSAPSANTVTVGYNQSNGTALNGSDYQALGNHVLTFAPGETVKTVQVNLLDNTVLEPTESFYFNLFTPTNAQIKTEFARATIVDNDATAGAPVVSLSDFVIDESAREASFAVTLSRPSTGVVSMNYATVNGTALAGSDYVAKSGSLSFAPGETAKTVTVTLTNDTLAELAESFSLQISALSGATTLDALGTAVIEANDAPAAVLPFITVGDAVAGEQDTYANFVVRLSAPSANTVTVGYNQSNGTALNGSDYQALGNHLLIFAPGETVKTVRVNLLDNTTAEATETFNLNLFTPSNATVGTTTATATIIDDDPAPAGVVNISGSAGPDILTGTRFVDSLTGFAGNDVLSGGAGNDSMAGGPGNDLYLVEQAGDVVTEAANSGADRVISYVNYTLTANVEDLVLAGSALTGTGNTLNNVITGTAGNNTLSGGAGADTLNGGVGNDTLTGGDGNDTLNGGDGNDTLNGGVGIDTATGGAGNDTYVRDNAGDVVAEAAGGGTDTVQSSVSYALVANVENLALLGSSAINGTGNTLANVITGNAGNNVLDGGSGTDTVSYANATAAVTVNLSVVVAQNTGGAGTDTLSNFENATGSGFADTLIGNAGANVLNGGVGNDTLTGGDGNDTLNGGDGNDTLNGGVGIDTATGGAGNDTYVRDNAGDVVAEAAGGGTDTVQSSVSYTLVANVENLALLGSSAINGTGNTLANVITGNTGANTLGGGDGNDSLSGGDGNDSLVGGAGNDTLTGGNNRDIQTGGPGDDRFDFNALAESLPNTGALIRRDVLTDFAGNGALAGDQIDLTGIDANPGLAGDQAFTYIGAASFSAVGQVRYSGGVVQANIDLNFAPDMEIELTGAPVLAVSAVPGTTDILL